MTRMARPTLSFSGPANDPFRYGWRLKRRVLADGSEEFDQVPLTLEDVLHPEEEDFIVHSTAHDRDTIHLREVLRARRHRWRKRAVVLHDCRVNWGIRGLRAHGPDLAVFFGVRNPNGQWSTFDVAEEEARPILVVEVTSPETRVNDVSSKVKHYHRAGVRQYVIVDARETIEGRTLSIIDYRHEPKGYRREPPDAEGRVPMVGLGLVLGVRGERIALYDVSTSEEQGDYEDVVAKLEQTAAAKVAAEEAITVAEEALTEAVEARNAERTARKAAETRMREEAAARANAERQAEQESKARAAAERRARQEARARLAAEKQLASIQAQLEAVRRKPPTSRSVSDATDSDEE